MLSQKKVVMGTQEEVNLPIRSACSGIADVLFSRIKVKGRSILKLIYGIDFSFFKIHFSTNLL